MRLEQLTFTRFLGDISILVFHYGIYILQKHVYTWVNGIMTYFNIDNTIVIFYSALSLLILLLSTIKYKFFETPL